MRFKKDRTVIHMDIQTAVQNYLKWNLSQLFTQSYYLSSGVSFQEKLCQVMAMAITEGVKVALDNMYTDEDFEKDLGLNR